MDGATINTKIYAGRGKAALRLGLDYQVYRPSVTASPLTALVATIKAAFNSGDNGYKKPNLPGESIWFGDFDGNLTHPGDYLIRTGSTYFIAGQQPLLPIICISCNRSITITRQTAQAAVGELAYGGLDPATETIVLGSTAPWPCSILYGSKGKGNKTSLPLDVDQAGWRVMLPPAVPITIKTSDIIADDLGIRYQVTGAELTDLGWRINANEVHS